MKCDRCTGNLTGDYPEYVSSDEYDLCTSCAGHTIDDLQKENEQLKAKLNRIKEWAKAYPVEAFPEPDLKKARELLEAGGMTLDAISASNMRHILNRLLEIVDLLKG